jgi:hypothetical protein
VRAAARWRFILFREGGREGTLHHRPQANEHDMIL